MQNLKILCEVLRLVRYGIRGEWVGYTFPPDTMPDKFFRIFAKRRSALFCRAGFTLHIVAWTHDVYFREWVMFVITDLLKYLFPLVFIFDIFSSFRFY